MLEDFVRADVADYCECQGISLTEKQMDTVVNSVLNDDEWYDIMTSNIQSAVEEVRTRKKRG